MPPGRFSYSRNPSSLSTLRANCPLSLSPMSHRHQCPPLSLVDACERGYFKCPKCDALFLEPVEDTASGAFRCPQCDYPNLKHYPPAFNSETQNQTP
jgi:DNA-directed RNA polymerase subunit RPC12/RpoP